MANEKTEQTAQEQAIPANAPQEAAIETAKPKKDGRKKDPKAPNVLPFQLVSFTNRQRVNAIGKPNDATLGILLDAYEKGGAVSGTQADDKTIQQLQDEIKNLKLQLQEVKSANSSSANDLQKLNEEIAGLKQKLSAKEQEIAAKEQQITGKDAEIAAKEQTISDQATKIANLMQRVSELENANATEADAEIQSRLQELTNRATKAEEEAKQAQTLINGLNEAKRNLQKDLDKAKKELKDAQDKYLDFERGATEGSANIYPEGDILHFFPTITARMLELTAQRLTASRTDGKEITPAMVLGDMFNRYTIDQFNLWFFKWVLSDSDMIAIAQEVEPKITSKKLLRAALGIK